MLGGKNQAITEVGTGFIKATTANCDRQVNGFFGELIDKTHNAANIRGVFGDSNHAWHDFKSGAICRISLQNGGRIKNIPNDMLI